MVVFLSKKSFKNRLTVSRLVNISDKLFNFPPCQTVHFQRFEKGHKCNINNIRSEVSSVKMLFKFLFDFIQTHTIAVFHLFGIKLSNVNNTINMILIFELVEFFRSVKFFAKIFSNSVPVDLLIFSGEGIFASATVAMTFKLMFIQLLFSCIDIVELLFGTGANLANMMALFKMFQNLIEIFVVDILHSRIVLFAHVAFHVGGGSQMTSQGISIIESLFAKLTIGVVKDKFPIQAILSLFKMGVEFFLVVDVLLRNETFFILKANITGVIEYVPELFFMCIVQMFFEYIDVVEHLTALSAEGRSGLLNELGHFFI